MTEFDNTFSELFKRFEDKLFNLKDLQKFTRRKRQDYIKIDNEREFEITLNDKLYNITNTISTEEGNEDEIFTTNTILIEGNIDCTWDKTVSMREKWPKIRKFLHKWFKTSKDIMCIVHYTDNYLETQFYMDKNCLKLVFVNK